MLYHFCPFISQTKTKQIQHRLSKKANWMTRDIYWSVPVQVDEHIFWWSINKNYIANIYLTLLQKYGENDTVYKQSWQQVVHLVTFNNVPACRNLTSATATNEEHDRKFDQNIVNHFLFWSRNTHWFLIPFCFLFSLIRPGWTFPAPGLLFSLVEKIESVQYQFWMQALAQAHRRC